MTPAIQRRARATRMMAALMSMRECVQPGRKADAMQMVLEYITKERAATDVGIVYTFSRDVRKLASGSLDHRCSHRSLCVTGS